MSDPADLADLPIVTFFASSPTKRFPQTNYTDLDNSGLDGSLDQTFLYEVYDTLETKQGGTPTGLPIVKAQRMLVRVSSVQEIDQWLRAYFPKGDKSVGPIRMQVVGHAVAGSLALGASWPNDPPRPNAYEIFDSNPAALNLIDFVDGKIVELMLAGCYVASRVANVNAIDGRTLLFTFAEMWHCKVRGASTNVSNDDFKNGIYVGRPAEPPAGWAWYSREQRLSAPALISEYSAIKFQPGKVPRPIALVLRGTRFDDPDHLDALTDYYTGILPTNRVPVLANIELAFDLEYKGSVSRAMLVCNGQFLAVETEGVRTFYGNAEGTDSLALEHLIDELQREARRAPASTPLSGS